jgi:hypothetical protein
MSTLESNNRESDLPNRLSSFKVTELLERGYIFEFHNGLYNSEEMRVLLIDNRSLHIKELLNQLKTEYVKICDFKELKDIGKNDFIAGILSRGSSMAVKTHLSDYYGELDLVKSLRSPILGIA